MNETILGITKWTETTGDDGNVTGLSGLDTFKTYDYNLYKYVNGRTWKLENSHLCYSMAVGSFSYLDLNSTYASFGTPQVAVAELQMNTSETQGMIFWGVVGSWNETDGISFRHYDSQNIGDAASNNVRPVVVAADLDDESMQLGSPTCISITDNVEVLAYVQAPPRHYDVISGDLNSSDEYGEGNCVVDAFSQLSEYNTAFNWDESTSAFKSTTNTHGFDFGASYSYAKSKKCNISMMTYSPFSFEAAVTGDFDWANKDNKTLTISTQTSATTGQDDDLYCRTNDIDMWRYLILYPESMRTSTSGDVTMQNFLQVAVPVETTDTFTAASGRKLNWYEPMHDNFNLFTYPIELSQITGYPQGSANKSAEDPYQDLNGQVFVKGEHQQIGKTGSSSYKLSINQDEGTEKDYTCDVTAGLDFNFNLQTGTAQNEQGQGGSEAHHVFQINGDYCYHHDSVTATDASDVKGMTVNWSNAISYQNKGGFSLEDQTFYSDIAIFTRDDGGFCIGYSVSELRYIGILRLAGLLERNTESFH